MTVLNDVPHNSGDLVTLTDSLDPFVMAHAVVCTDAFFYGENDVVCVYAIGSTVVIMLVTVDVVV